MIKSIRQVFLFDYRKRLVRSDVDPPVNLRIQCTHELFFPSLFRAPHRLREAKRSLPPCVNDVGQDWGWFGHLHLRKPGR